MEHYDVATPREGDAIDFLAQKLVTDDGYGQASSLLEEGEAPRTPDSSPTSDEPEVMGPNIDLAKLEVVMDAASTATGATSSVTVPASAERSSAILTHGTLKEHTTREFLKTLEAEDVESVGDCSTSVMSESLRRTRDLAVHQQKLARQQADHLSAMEEVARLEAEEELRKARVLAQKIGQDMVIDKLEAVIQEVELENAVRKSQGTASMVSRASGTGPKPKGMVPVRLAQDSSHPRQRTDHSEPDVGKNVRHKWSETVALDFLNMSTGTLTDLSPIQLSLIHI